MNLFQELKEKFRTGDILTRLLLINCAMFVLILLLDITFTLITFGTEKFAEQLFQFPWNPLTLAFRPWTVITAMFTSHGLWHLLFNMFTLYWLGGIFLQYYTSNHLRGLYVLGAIAGMALFTATFMLFPGFALKDWSATIPLASVSILTFCTALAFRAPNHQEQIPLIGPVKLKYIIIILGVTDAALIPSINPASDAAHLGGVLTGWLFYRLLVKGRDLTAPVTAVAIWLYGLFNKNR